ncbi:type II secretion system protein [Planctomycetota bacterium]
MGNRRVWISSEGFTLVELLVVIAIVMLLVALIMPITTMVRETARRAACMSQLRQIGMALHAYAGDNMGRFPHDPSTSSGVVPYPLITEMTPDYISEPRVLYCPSGAYFYYLPWIPKTTFELSYPTRIGYYYLNRSHWVKDPRTLQHPGDFTLMTDVASQYVTQDNIHRKGRQGGINRLHIDNSVTWMNGSLYAASPGIME